MYKLQTVHKDMKRNKLEMIYTKMKQCMIN